MKVEEEEVGNLNKKNDPAWSCFLGLCLFVCFYFVQGMVHMCQCMYAGQDSFAGVCFLCHVGSGDQIQAINLSGKRLYH